MYCVIFNNFLDTRLQKFFKMLWREENARSFISCRIWYVFTVTKTSKAEKVTVLTGVLLEISETEVIFIASNKSTI